MNTQYKIVSGTLSAVEELVTSLLRAGWELSGQLCVNERKVYNADNHSDNSKLIYSQSLTKK